VNPPAQRATLNLKRPAAGPTPDRQPLPVGGGSDERTRNERRLEQVIQQRNQVERDLAAAVAVSRVALQELARHPEVDAVARPKIFTTCAHVLCDWDADAAGRLPEVLAALTPPAAAWVFSDIERGPSILVALARAPARLEKLAALADPLKQCVALGELWAEIENSRRPIVRLYSSGAPT
jgi:hypothetical protein